MDHGATKELERPVLAWSCLCWTGRRRTAEMNGWFHHTLSTSHSISRIAL